MTKEELISHLRNEGTGKAPHYDVPQGYFDQLPSRVMARIATEGAPKSEVSTLRLSWTKAVAAACLAVPFAVGILLYQSRTEEDYEMALHDLSENEYNEAMEVAGIDNSVIEAYLIENYHDDSEI